MVGTKLAHYEITSHLGTGGMGEVYQATDTKLGRSVAIKLLPEAFARDADRLTRFEREARLLALLNHPNIAAIYGLEESVGLKFLVMELVEGETLAERIKKAPVPTDEALGIAKQMGEALDAAHEKGIIHRDLKPANVKVTPYGKVKVLDFGLAKAFEAEPANVSMSNSPTMGFAATQVGMILGTAAYMAPEQARGKPVDKRADIWAFGVVLYELLTGELPFHGEDLGELFAAVIKEPVKLDGIPQEVRPLLRRCLEKDPLKRLRDIGDIRLLLDPDRTDNPTVILQPKGRRFWPWAAATLALSLVVVSVLHFREPAPPAPTTTRFSIPMPPKATFGNNLALSPDGRQVVFRAMTEGRSRLWVHSLDSLASRSLPGTEGSVNAPFWSYDGRTIVFGVSGQLKKISVAGGPATTLCETPGNLTGGFWTSDNRIVFGTARSGLFQIPAGGGSATPLTRLGKDESSHQMPALLSDGKHFVYLHRSSNADVSGIFLRSLDAKLDDPDLKKLLPDDSAVYFAVAHGAGAAQDSGHLIFTRENVLTAQPFNLTRLELDGDATPIAQGVAGFGTFYASGDGTLVYGSVSGENRELAWYDRRGQRLGGVWKPGPFFELELSPDGSRVAVARDQANSLPDIWVYEFERNTETQITSDPAADAHPVWSPNGEQIVYYSSRGGAPQFFTRNASGAGPEVVLAKFDGISTVNPQSWSRDNRFLLYEPGMARTGRDLMVLPLENGTAGKPFVFLNGEGIESLGQFSPNGRYVAYVMQQSGRTEVYVSTFPNPAEGRWTISSGGGYQPRWRRDGKELLYFTGDGKLMSVDVTLNPAFRNLKTRELLTVPIYGSGTTANQTRWDISPDGQKFLINTDIGETSVPLTVVLNWQPLK